MRPVEPFHVRAIERRLHRPDAAEQALHLRQVMGREHAGLAGGFVGGVGEDVPAAEDEVVECLERDELPDQRRAALGALPEPNRADLGQRADWRRQALADEFHPGHKRGADRSQAGRENAQRSVRRRDGGGPAHPTVRVIRSRKHVQDPPLSLCSSGDVRPFPDSPRPGGDRSPRPILFRAEGVDRISVAPPFVPDRILRRQRPRRTA